MALARRSSLTSGSARAAETLRVRSAVTFTLRARNHVSLRFAECVCVQCCVRGWRFACERSSTSYIDVSVAQTVRRADHALPLLKSADSLCTYSCHSRKNALTHIPW